MDIAALGAVEGGAARSIRSSANVVNVASRIEALNKELGATVLASDEVWSAAARPDVKTVSRDSITIRGRARPVLAWQLH